MVSFRQAQDSFANVCKCQGGRKAGGVVEWKGMGGKGRNGKEWEGGGGLVSVGDAGEGKIRRGSEKP